MTFNPPRTQAMGELADALRSNLRQLAQADARLLRELDQTLPSDELDGLNLKQLKERCKQLGLKGYSTLKKPELINRLRASESRVGGGTARPLPPASNEMAAVQARLDRLEGLLVRIAAHLGVEA
jgi:hypothetical protein